MKIYRLFWINNFYNNEYVIPDSNSLFTPCWNDTEFSAAKIFPDATNGNVKRDRRFSEVNCGNATALQPWTFFRGSRFRDTVEYSLAPKPTRVVSVKKQPTAAHRVQNH